ncbi:MAG: hypothetical protein EOO90_14410 [Pedobacter sp.]|nr:MAG: hypothetical protein EOO90_14410 [Pedobacter sp.]
MITSQHSLEQEVLQDNKEIFARLVKELEGADFELLIATAWFTDEELFDIVKSKAAQRVSVKLIIADNQENRKLPFDELVALGASVTKIKGAGYGNMNQKFCVIDKRIAMHGSYNWSVNARKNNHESIIVTNHTETVASLIDTFNDIENKITSQGEQPIEDNIQTDKSEVLKLEKHTAKEHAVSEFTKVLDSMIAAEIGNFDRSMLSKQGYERSKFNNGDHQVLTKALDTVYSVFINDIDVVEDKKRRLLTKIDEQEIKSINAFQESLALQLQSAEVESENEILNAKNKLINLKSDVEKNSQIIDGIKNTKIEFHQNIIGEIKDKIRHAKREFISPKFKWYEFIPVLTANICLIIYLFIFYSSACYILLFAVEDSKIAMQSGLESIPMEIFNPKAINLTIEKGGSGILFIFLFVSIPIFCALIKLFTKNNWIVVPMFLVGILLIDTAIAYKVSSAIHQMKFDSGDSNEVWRVEMAFSDPNFYLVFLLGGFGLLMLKFAFDKLMSIFDERNPDIASLRSNVLVDQMGEDISLEEAKIVLLKEEIQSIESVNIGLDAQFKINEVYLSTLPNKLNLIKELKKTDLITGKQHISDIATIYKSHVQNDNIPISIDSLRDRINIFLEGWNDFLHERYSIPLAMEKSREAFDTAVSWQTEKMKNSYIDKRVQIS